MLPHPRQLPDDPGGSDDSSVRPGPRNDSAHDSDLETVWYVVAIQRWALPILLCGIVAGVLGFWYASRRPLAYQGTTTLLVVPSSQPTGAQINPATFRAVVENATLASQVIDELKLPNITPQTFLERALVVEEVRGTNIVKVKVTLGDPRMAADTSRRLAQKAILLTQQITQHEGASIQEQLKNHLNAAHERLRNAEKELLTYKQNAQLDVIKEDTDAQLKERGALLSLVVGIEAERARLRAAETEIKRQQPLLSVARVPAAEDALRRAAQDAGRRTADNVRRRTIEEPGRRAADEALRQSESTSTSGVDPQHLDLTNPYVNPVYQTLDFQIATSRTRIAALEKQRDELINVKKIGGRELAQLSELYRRQIEQSRLEANFDLAMKVYGELAVRYEQSRTQPLGNIAQLQVVDAALPPEYPVSRRRLQTAMFGSAAGLVAAAFLALLLESRGRGFLRRES